MNKNYKYNNKNRMHQNNFYNESIEQNFYNNYNPYNYPNNFNTFQQNGNYPHNYPNYNPNNFNYYQEQNTFNQMNDMENKLRNICLNQAAQDYIPKQKNTENFNKETENTRLNVSADLFVPKGNFTSQNNHNSILDNIENAILEDEYIYNNNYNDNELVADDETDKEIWYPKYQNCECCEGFVYKCKGPACLNMAVCYCKVTDECNFDN